VFLKETNHPTENKQRGNHSQHNWECAVERISCGSRIVGYQFDCACGVHLRILRLALDDLEKKTQHYAKNYTIGHLGDKKLKYIKFGH
jgi:hypothetical protein